MPRTYDGGMPYRCNLNRPTFCGETIWKYMSIEGFEDFITKSRLKLTALNKWQGNDSSECTYDEKQLTLRDEVPGLNDTILRDPTLFMGYLNHVKIFQSRSGSSTRKLESRLKSLENEAYAASFHTNDEPDQYMLDNYGPVAVKTTVDKLDLELDKSRSDMFFKTGWIEYLEDSTGGSWFPNLEVLP
jgi:hypothetical protein